MPSSISTIQHPGLATARADATRATEGARAGTEAEKPDEGMSFWDLLDVINPLQHIPVVNRIYRAVTGDEIKTPARLAGSALMFGPVGLAVAAADSALQHETGRDAMGHALALFDGGDEPQDAPTAVAEAPAAAPQAPAADPGQPQVADAAELRRLMERRQAEELAEGPAATAARAALAGLPAAAAVGTLPAPGSGMDAATLAALSGQPAREEPAQGKGLNQYRQLAGTLQPVTAPRPYVPPVAVQAALNEREKPGAAALVSRVTNPALVTEAAQRAAAESMAAEALAAADPTPAATTGQDRDQAPGQDRQPGSWPPGGAAPLPPALIADMMALAMDKYEAQSRTRQQEPRQPTAVNGRF